MPLEKTLFITSLSPKGNEDIQQAAIASWLIVGGQVISTNSPEEIAVLSPRYPGVKFEALSRTAASVAQKPVPFIDDMLRLAERQRHPFMVINADIVLSDQPQTLRAAVECAAHGNVVCGARWDVDDAIAARQALADGQDISGDVSLGYDYFILPAALASKLPRTQLALGMPFWDYWLPLAALLSGAKIFDLTTPFALHSRHETVWNHTKFFFFSVFLNAILDQYTPLYGGHGPRDALAETMIRYEHTVLSDKARSPDATDADLTALSDFYDRQFQVLLHHLRTSLAPLEVPV